MDPSESEEVDILASSQGFLVPILSGEEFSLSSLSVMLFLSLYACMLSHFSLFWLFVTLWPVALGFHCPWDSPGRSTEVGCPALLQGIFLTQGSNPPLCLLLVGGFFTTSAIWDTLRFYRLLPCSSAHKESACNARKPSSIPASGRSAGEGIGHPHQYSWASLVAQLVKNLPAMWETWVWSLGWEDPLKNGNATHSRIWPGEVHGVKKDWIRLSNFHFYL